MAISEQMLKEAYERGQQAIERAQTLKVGDRIAILDYRTGKTMAYATVATITGQLRYPMSRKFWPCAIEMTSWGRWRLKHPDYKGGDNPRLWCRGFENGCFGQGFDSQHLRLVSGVQ